MPDGERLLENEAKPDPEASCCRVGALGNGGTGGGRGWPNGLREPVWCDMMGFGDLSIVLDLMGVDAGLTIPNAFAPVLEAKAVPPLNAEVVWNGLAT